MATPFTAVTVRVPESVPAPGLAPSASVTGPANEVARLPRASRAWTTIAGALAVPAVGLPGCALKASCVGVGAPVAVAFTVSGFGVTPELATERVCGPVVPSVQTADALPCASVVALAGTTLPPPIVTAKTTVRPDAGTRLPLSSVSCTTIGAGSAVPEAAD